MLFHFPQRRINDIDLSLKINNQRIDRVHEFNFLGTIIHETLEWTRHIDKVANKISRTLGILNKLRYVLPVYTLKTMYDALIVPHLNYNILLCGTECQNYNNKKAIRIITCGKYNSHTEPIFKRLNLLKVDDIFTCQCMSFYHKHVNNNVPLFCKSLFTCNASSRISHSAQSATCYSLQPYLTCEKEFQIPPSFFVEKYAAMCN